MNVTDRSSVQAMLKQTVLAYGGLDNIVVTAGIFVAPDRDGHITDAQWKLTFDVNVMGSYLVADEARGIWARQGLRGSLAMTTSVNAIVSKKGSLAYDTSKAAANHLIRGFGGAKTCAASARERTGPGHSGRGIDDVPARAGYRIAREIRNSF